MAEKAEIALLIDFGSTYTKALLIDLIKEEVIGRAQSMSTVQTNIINGLQSALQNLISDNPAIHDETLNSCRKYACSSAAGGLRLIAIGLVPELTLEAARRAALGAGAKVIGSYSYEICDDDICKMESTAFDILLLSGGIDGGDKKIILHNAKKLAASSLNIPFVIAGNRVVSNQIKSIFLDAGKYAEVTENVLPELNQLNVEPARSIIRDIFMKRIVYAKGLDSAEAYVGNILMPTPLATLKAAQLLADGYEDESGLGELMIVEIGGATTNIHSVAKGDTLNTNVIIKGIPEPYAKRTVEGDLGIRYNASTIVQTLGESKIRNNLPVESVKTQVNIAESAAFLSRNVGFVPVDECDLFCDLALAKSAAGVAVERHVGVIKEAWSPQGIVNLQYGKDLTRLKTIIGTGGIFAYNMYSERIFESVLFSKENPFSLKPKAPDIYVDHKYIMYGIGLLSETEPAIALRIAKKYLRSIA